MTKDITTIVFDWDGVIVDSMPLYAIGIAATAASYGVPITVEYVLNNYIQPRVAFYESLGIKPEDPEEIYQRHTKANDKHFGVAPLFVDVVPALQQLQASGYLLAIATQNEVANAQTEVERVGLREFFLTRHIIGGQNKKTEKLQHLATVLSCDPETMLYVGDLTTDVVAARTVGTKSAAIVRAEGQRARLAAEHPDYLVTDLQELAKQLISSK